jgi:hypothetical protein
MRRIPAVVAVVALVAVAAPAKAQSSSFAGKWVNVDPNPRAIISLNITVSDEKVTVEGKTSCGDLQRLSATLYHGLKSPNPVSEVLAYATGDLPPQLGREATDTGLPTLVGIIRLLTSTDGDYLVVEHLTRLGGKNPPSHTRFILRRETR